MNTLASLYLQKKATLKDRLQYIKLNFDEARISPYTLPNSLQLANGQIVNGAIEWRKNRRPEIIDLFQRYIYGYSPQACNTLNIHGITNDSSALSGLATRKEIMLLLTGKLDGPQLHLLVYLPNCTPTPVPAFLGLNFYGNHSIHPDPGICLTGQWQQRNRKAAADYILPSEETRGSESSDWPVERILQRGYALATAYYGDLEPDFPGGWRYGIRSAFQVHPQANKNPVTTQETLRSIKEIEGSSGHPVWAEPDEWGAIGAWAWGLSRILDYLESDPDINAHQVVLFGHSRLGKAALWAGAQDERFAIIISNNSGCGGAALFRRRFGETIKLLNQVRPHWFCKYFKNFNNKEDELPVDQHMLIALLAPRPVYVGSAEQDLAADPRGEFLSAKHADPVYSLFGLSGPGQEDIPGVNEPVGETVRYHIRSGQHDMTDYDWNQYLHFADRHLRIKTS